MNNLYGWTMPQKLPANSYDRVEDTFRFHKDFMKSYNEESYEGHFFEVDVQYPEKLHEVHNNLPFLPEKEKLKT